MTGTIWLVAQLALYNLGAWLLTYLIHSSVILGLVWAMSRALRLSPAWEVVLWRTALVGGVVTSSVRLAAGELAGEEWLVDGAAVLTGGFGVFGATLTAAWLVLASIRLQGWWRARQSLLGAIGARRSDEDLSLRAMSDHVIRELGLPRRPLRFTRAPGVTSPVAVGAGEVCLPERGFEYLDDVQRRSVLAHEIGHLAFRDPLWRTVAQLVRAALFIQPLNRLAARRLKEAAEFRADDAAVRSAGARSPLVEALLAFAQNGRRGSEVDDAIGFASLLWRRVDRLYAGPPPGAAVVGPVRFGAAVLLLGAALAVPGIDPPCDCRLRAALAEFARPDAVAARTSAEVGPRESAAAPSAGVAPEPGASRPR
ncbi:MAG TPA: M56 family metallopeptidase [Longimicrobiales bacterium]|nr:M56 family metallopeptidase [Longimicrobiales bacterium]